MREINRNKCQHGNTWKSDYNKAKNREMWQYFRKKNSCVLESWDTPGKTGYVDTCMPGYVCVCVCVYFGEILCSWNCNSNWCFLKIIFRLKQISDHYEYCHNLENFITFFFYRFKANLPFLPRCQSIHMIWHQVVGLFCMEKFFRKKNPLPGF